MCIYIYTLKFPDIPVSTREEARESRPHPEEPRFSPLAYTTVTRGSALWESLVGKPRGKASWESLEGKPQRL